MEGYVYNIRRYSRHDGPGVRTTVFLKGCPLRCQWCSSPQTWSLKPEPVFLASKCIGCGKCLHACKNGAINMLPGAHRINYSKCIKCGACAKACPSQAIRMDAQKMTSEEVVDIVERDKKYYRPTGGGITLSGGEVLAQADFSADIFRLSQEAGIHTCIESSAYGSWDALEKILKHTKIAYFDLKHVDDAAHRELTGVSNEIIKQNIEKAAKSGLCRVVVNLPAIPGMNDSEKNIRAMAFFLHEIGLSEVKYLSFHKLGQHEYEELGWDYPVKDLPANEPEEDDDKKAFFESLGIHIVTK